MEKTEVDRTSRLKRGTQIVLTAIALVSLLATILFYLVAGNLKGENLKLNALISQYQKDLENVQKKYGEETNKSKTEVVVEGFNLLVPAFWNERVLQEKKYKNGIVRSYRVTEQGAPLSDLFLIALTPFGKSDLPSVWESPTTGWKSQYVVSRASTYLSEKNLFEIIDNNVYVVDAEMTHIKVYEITTDGPDGQKVTSFKYVETITLPNDVPGTITGILCENERCTVSAGIGQEAGCSLTLNPKTKSFSELECDGIGVTFVPEKR